MIWHRFIRRLRDVLRAQDGNMLILGGFLLSGVLAFSGVALDFGYVVDLRRKLQVAADMAAHEYARGRDQAQLQLLCRATVEGCIVQLEGSAPDVSVRVCANYEPLFDPIYKSLGVNYPSPEGGIPETGAGAGEGAGTGEGAGEEGGASTASLWVCARGFSTISAAPACTLPDEDEETRWVETAGICPAGQTGTLSEKTEEKRTASCPEGATEPVWSSWVPTGNRQTVNTCEEPQLQCREDDRQPRYRWSATREEACPNGENYGAIHYRVRQASYPSCAANNDEGWTEWVDVAPEERARDVVNSCSSSCLKGKFTRWQEDRQSNAIYCPSTQQMEDMVGLREYTTNYHCVRGEQRSNGWRANNTWKYLEPDCPTGGKAFTAPGTYSWTVPERVRRVSVLVVGGGASGSVAASETGTFSFGPGEASIIYAPSAVTARGGGYDALSVGENAYDRPGTAGGCNSSKEGGSCGGDGGRTPIRWDGDQTWTEAGTALVSGGGGGGAAGYRESGNAGRGAAINWDTMPQGGHSGGGGGGYYRRAAGGGGGGVGINSYADNGVWSQNGAAGGGGGSGGQSAGQGSDYIIQGAGGVVFGADGGSHGGGGGGVMAPSAAKSWDKGYAGGGGELSYRNGERVTPGTTITVTVGKGGEAPAPVEIRVGSRTYLVRPGSGAQGAARIIWGVGCWNQERRFPDAHASEDIYERCAWDPD
ncbi:pilus assembly protein TadG-related protein [Xanthobacter sp. TB0139]|uniref:pilus assembly protein TadG-related protein n=1 Tax=Xanthobacter sp. TB0139 TaxID=3459178 RepID=UPI0040391C62